MDSFKWHNLGYLFWAYTLIWALLAGYLYLLMARLRRLKRDIERIRCDERDDAGRS